MSRIQNLKARIVNKHGSARQWFESVDFIPLNGETIVYEPGYDPVDGRTYTTARTKIGDGIHTIQELHFTNKYQAIVTPTTTKVELLTHSDDSSYTPASYVAPSMTHNVNDDLLTINFDAGSFTPAIFTPATHISTTVEYISSVDVDLVALSDEN